MSLASRSELQLRARGFLKDGDIDALVMLTWDLVDEDERLPRKSAADVARALAAAAAELPSCNRRELLRAALIHVPSTEFYKDELSPDAFVKIKAPISEIQGSRSSTTASGKNGSDSESQSGSPRRRSANGGGACSRGARPSRAAGARQDRGSPPGDKGTRKGKGYPARKGGQGPRENNLRRVQTLLDQDAMQELASCTQEMADSRERLPRQEAGESAEALARAAASGRAAERRTLMWAAWYHVPKLEFYQERLSSADFARVQAALDELRGRPGSIRSPGSPDSGGSDIGWGTGSPSGTHRWRNSGTGGGWADDYTTSGGPSTAGWKGSGKGYAASTGSRKPERKPVWELMHDFHTKTWNKLPFGFSLEAEAAFEAGHTRADVGKQDWNTRKLAYSLDFSKMTCKLGDNLQALRRLDAKGDQTHPDPSLEHPYVAKRLAGRVDDWLTDAAFFDAFKSQIGLPSGVTADSIFDFSRNEDFRGHTSDLKPMTRGGQPYHAPVGCKRFAVKVKGQFDSGDNTWMKMDDSGWAVAYHGTSQAGCWGILQQGLKPGGAQAYLTNKDARTGEVIGNGVYCAPSLDVAVQYARSRGAGAKIAGRDVLIIMQCRVKPEKIKRCQDEKSNSGAYWVINDPSDIRPYGVLVKPM
mmetsp:Transcript_34614/g.90323  ORF Transcript_34614/g.90323 Transcript_34614/m.90323 type:complete len:644 (+) Transcript_34614:60-1991(+)